MTARRHPSYTRPVPVDFARPDAPVAFRAWHGIESEDPPYERHNHEAMLTMADRLLATRERRLPKMVRNGDITVEDARAQIATISAIGADWHWIITGEGEPAPLSTLAARRLLLDQSIIAIAAEAREREGFSAELEDQGHLIIAMRWHLEPERLTHLHARANHAARRAIPQEIAHAA
jgi:hypothetical protein